MKNSFIANTNMFVTARNDLTMEVFTLYEFAKDLYENQVDLDAEIVEIVNEHFDELI